MKQRPCCIVLGIALLASGCGTADKDSGLNGSGATFIYPMMTKWSKEYEHARGINVDYQSIGSGGGIKQMTSQTVDFCCSDGPMDDGQLKEAKGTTGEVVHIPLVMGAVVPVYNLPQVKEPLRFSGPVLAEIYLGKITNWSDPALRNLNPNAALPDLKIEVHVRGDASGTTFIWADYLSKVSPEWKQRAGVGSSIDWPTGLRGKG